MKSAKSTAKLDSVFVVVVFCIFAASVLMVLMLGSEAYQNTSGIINENNDERTALSFIWSKVKNCDAAGSVYIGEFDGLSTLFLDEMIEGYTFQTLIYFYNGWIYELFTEAGFYFYPEDGTRVVRAGGLEFTELQDGLIKASTDAGSLILSLRGSPERSR